jgi:hypothetical protein
MSEPRWLAMVCSQCRAAFETTEDRPARCPACGRRFGAIRESESHPGRALQSAETWQDLVTRGRSTSAEEDSRKWELGALAAEVANVYGQSVLRPYADAIGSTYEELRAYLKVDRAYPTPAQRTYDLPWQHYYRVSARSDRQQLLQNAWVNMLSAEQMMAQTQAGESNDTGSSLRRCPVVWSSLSFSAFSWALFRQCGSSCAGFGIARRSLRTHRFAWRGVGAPSLEVP